MPLYEYKCSVCGNNEEKLQTFNGEAPVCCGKPMKKGFGSILQVFYMPGLSQQRPEPVTHDSKLLARQAHRAWEMEMA